MWVERECRGDERGAADSLYVWKRGDGVFWGGVVVLGVWGGEWGVAREAEKEDWRDRKTNHEIMRVSK